MLNLKKILRFYLTFELLSNDNLAMQTLRNLVINGADNKPISFDVHYEMCNGVAPLVIYAHGFNGYKDWGNGDLLASYFVAQGFTFLKMNFSHNGTSPEKPNEFVDLEAFGQNNFSKQLEDLRLLLDWICAPKNPLQGFYDVAKICLIGHSMGGGTAILFASEDARITKLVTWAAIAEAKTPWGKWSEEKMTQWKTDGVAYYLNGRTQQQMPLYYQLFEDFETNTHRLDILAAAKKMAIPWLIMHGTEDEAVALSQAEHLKNANADAQLLTLKTNHVFGRQEPWTETSYAPITLDWITQSIVFLK